MVFLHQVQIKIRLQTEHGQRREKHFSMLRGGYEKVVKNRLASFNFQDDRGHLNYFRPGPYDADNFRFHPQRYVRHTSVCRWVHKINANDKLKCVGHDFLVQVKGALDHSLHGKLLDDAVSGARTEFSVTMWLVQ